ncbi:MAG TPA: phospholipid carrier-dependent glycosyltransferase [Gammaproteobacteria bacterium]|nr:phospholipid carrier-dependent glycosyltransferase [Gammaproteobacteria bacterium]
MTKCVLVAGVVLALVLLARGWLAGTLPLTDTTEARYAEISRKMVETSDYVTPQDDYGVPFWAKPPLAMWASAGGIALLGATELAPRLPILLISAAFLALFFVSLEAEIGAGAAALGTVVLASSLLFFVSMAAVMTDMILAACVGAALLAFWARWRGAGPLAEAALYLALGLGLLAKGPVAAVLTLGPIALWSLALRRTGLVWRRFAWIKGAILALAVSLPWYVAAELRTPGFLKYFIVGEHLSRFLVPHWQGDLYGHPHNVAFGTIWIYLLVGLLPWSILLLPLPLTRRKAFRSRWAAHRELIVFGLCWAAVPLLLFSFAANIITPYALPAMPGAVAAFMAACGRPGEDRALRRLAWVGCACVLIPSVWLAARANRPEFATRFTQKHVIEAIHTRHPNGCAIRYWQDRYFSAEYYSGGAAGHVENPIALEHDVEGDEPLCVVVETARADSIPAGLARRLRETFRLGEFSVLEPLPKARARHYGASDDGASDESPGAEGGSGEGPSTDGASAAGPH